MTDLTRVSLTTLITFSLFIMPAHASESDDPENSTEQQSETDKELEELLEEGLQLEEHLPRRTLKGWDEYRMHTRHLD